MKIRYKIPFSEQQRDSRSKSANVALGIRGGGSRGPQKTESRSPKAKILRPRSQSQGATPYASVVRTSDDAEGYFRFGPPESSREREGRHHRARSMPASRANSGSPRPGSNHTTITHIPKFHGKYLDDVLRDRNYIELYPEHRQLVRSRSPSKEEEFDPTAVLEINLSSSVTDGQKLRKVPLLLTPFLNVQILNLSGNAIQKIENLRHMRKMRALDLSRNQLSRLEGIGELTSLVKLNVAGNLITRLTSEMSNLDYMEELDVSGNNFNSLLEFRHLKACRKLWILYCRTNPIDQIKNCGDFLVYHLPQVEYLNDTPITNEIRSKAQFVFGNQSEENKVWQEQLERKSSLKVEETEKRNMSLQEENEKLKAQLEFKNQLLEKKSLETSQTQEKLSKLEQRLAFHTIDSKQTQIEALSPDRDEKNPFETPTRAPDQEVPLLKPTVSNLSGLVTAVELNPSLTLSVDESRVNADNAMRVLSAVGAPCASGGLDRFQEDPSLLIKGIASSPQGPGTQPFEYTDDVGHANGATRFRDENLCPSYEAGMEYRAPISPRSTSEPKASKDQLLIAEHDDDQTTLSRIASVGSLGFTSIRKKGDTLEFQRLALDVNDIHSKILKAQEREQNLLRLQHSRRKKLEGLQRQIQAIWSSLEKIWDELERVYVNLDPTGVIEDSQESLYVKLKEIDERRTESDRNQRSIEMLKRRIDAVSDLISTKTADFMEDKEAGDEIKKLQDASQDDSVVKDEEKQLGAKKASKCMQYDQNMVRLTRTLAGLQDDFAKVTIEENQNQSQTKFLEMLVRTRIPSEELLERGEGMFMEEDFTVDELLDNPVPSRSANETIEHYMERLKSRVHLGNEIENSYQSMIQETQNELAELMGHLGHLEGIRLALEVDMARKESAVQKMQARSLAKMLHINPNKNVKVPEQVETKQEPKQELKAQEEASSTIATPGTGNASEKNLPKINSFLSVIRRLDAEEMADATFVSPFNNPPYGLEDGIHTFSKPPLHPRSEVDLDTLSGVDQYVSDVDSSVSGVSSMKHDRTGRKPFRLDDDSSVSSIKIFQPKRSKSEPRGRSRISRTAQGPHQEFQMLNARSSEPASLGQINHPLQFKPVPRAKDDLDLPQQLRVEPGQVSEDFLMNQHRYVQSLEEHFVMERAHIAAQRAILEAREKSLKDLQETQSRQFSLPTTPIIHSNVASPGSGNSSGAAGKHFFGAPNIAPIPTLHLPEQKNTQSIPSSHTQQSTPLYNANGHRVFGEDSSKSSLKYGSRRLSSNAVAASSGTGIIRHAPDSLRSYPSRSPEGLEQSTSEEKVNNINATCMISPPGFESSRACEPLSPSEVLEAQRKLKILRQKLDETLPSERRDPKTGFALSPTGESRAQVEVNILAARDLPAMKKMSGSCDPYVSVSLRPEGDVSTKTTPVVPDQRYPQWSTYFELRPIHSMEHAVTFKVYHRDSSKHILMGSAELSLEILSDQKKHSLWLPLTPPVISKKAIYNPLNNISPYCALRVQIRFAFSRVQKLKDMIFILEMQLRSFETTIASLEPQDNNSPTKTATESPQSAEAFGHHSPDQIEQTSLKKETQSHSQMRQKPPPWLKLENRLKVPRYQTPRSALRLGKLSSNTQKQSYEQEEPKSAHSPDLCPKDIPKEVLLESDFSDHSCIKAQTHRSSRHKERKESEENYAGSVSINSSVFSGQSNSKNNQQSTQRSKSEEGSLGRVLSFRSIYSEKNRRSSSLRSLHSETSVRHQKLPMRGTKAVKDTPGLSFQRQERKISSEMEKNDMAESPSYGGKESDHQDQGLSQQHKDNDQCYEFASDLVQESDVTGFKDIGQEYEYASDLAQDYCSTRSKDIGQEYEYASDLAQDYCSTPSKDQNVMMELSGQDYGLASDLLNEDVPAPKRNKGQNVMMQLSGQEYGLASDLLNEDLPAPKRNKGKRPAPAANHLQRPVNLSIFKSPTMRYQAVRQSRKELKGRPNHDNVNLNFHKQMYKTLGN